MKKNIKLMHKKNGMITKRKVLKILQIQTEWMEIKDLNAKVYQ